MPLQDLSGKGKAASRNIPSNERKLEPSLAGPWSRPSGSASGTQREQQPTPGLLGMSPYKFLIDNDSHLRPDTSRRRYFLVLTIDSRSSISTRSAEPSPSILFSIELKGSKISESSIAKSSTVLKLHATSKNPSSGLIKRQEFPALRRTNPARKESGTE